MLTDGFLVRRWGPGLMAWVWLGLGALSVTAQSAPATPGTQDNPFPADPGQEKAQGKAPAKGGQPQQPAGTGQSAAEPAKPAGGNEFPGESSNAPIIPVEQGPVDRRPADRDARSRSGAGGNGEASGSGAAESDPVRSPDGDSTEDGFSSSGAGLSPAMEDDDSRAPGPATKTKSRKQEIKEDIDVGGFYLEKKNWKAALDRFTTAFTLDGENPDAVWGLAEAERHLTLLDKAKEHYELFLSYDPKGPHGKAARKALEQLEQARSSTSGTPGTPSNPPH